MQSADIRSATFPRVRLREGYSIEDVDRFLHKAADDLDVGRLDPAWVNDVRFGATSLKQGYDMGAVDDFLDRIEEAARGLGRA